MSVNVCHFVRVFTLSALVLGATASTASAQSAPDRNGFTLLVNLGTGIQNDAGLEKTSVGLGGANLGIGGFVTPDLAISARFSGTNVEHETPLGYVNQVSGVLAPTVQYWLNDKVNVEAGVGLGIWSVDEDEDEASDRGLGLILGVGFTVFNRGKHNLQVGFEYAPAFTQPGAVHNLGITFGYQLF